MQHVSATWSPNPEVDTNLDDSQDDICLIEEPGSLVLINDTTNLFTTQQEEHLNDSEIELPPKKRRLNSNKVNQQKDTVTETRQVFSSTDDEDEIIPRRSSNITAVDMMKKYATLTQVLEKLKNYCLLCEDFVSDIENHLNVEHLPPKFPIQCPKCSVKLFLESLFPLHDSVCCKSN